MQLIHTRQCHTQLIALQHKNKIDMACNSNHSGLLISIFIMYSNSELKIFPGGNLWLHLQWEF